MSESQEVGGLVGDDGRREKVVGLHHGPLRDRALLSHVHRGDVVAVGGDKSGVTHPDKLAEKLVGDLIARSDMPGAPGQDEGAALGG